MSLSRPQTGATAPRVHLAGARDLSAARGFAWTRRKIRHHRLRYTLAAEVSGLALSEQGAWTRDPPALRNKHARKQVRAGMETMTAVHACDGGRGANVQDARN